MRSVLEQRLPVAQQGAVADAASRPEIGGILARDFVPNVFPFYRCGAAKRQAFGGSIEPISLKAGSLSFRLLEYDTLRLLVKRDYQDLWYALALTERSQRQCYATQPKKTKRTASWT